MFARSSDRFFCSPLARIAQRPFLCIYFHLSIHEWQWTSIWISWMLSFRKNLRGPEFSFHCVKLSWHCWTTSENEKKKSANGKSHSELKICKCFVVTHNGKLATIEEMRGKHHFCDETACHWYITLHWIQLRMKTYTVPWTKFKCIAHTSII